MNKKFEIKNKKILKNGTIAGYVKQKDGSWKWQFIKKTTKGGSPENNKKVKNEIHVNAHENAPAKVWQPAQLRRMPPAPAPLRRMPPAPAPLRRMPPEQPNNQQNGFNGHIGQNNGFNGPVEHIGQRAEQLLEGYQHQFEINAKNNDNKFKQLLDFNYYEATYDKSIIYIYKNSNNIVFFNIPLNKPDNELDISMVFFINSHITKYNILRELENYEIKNITNLKNYKEIKHNMNNLLQENKLLHNQAG